MVNPTPGESHSDPVLERLLADTLSGIRSALEPELAATVLPPDAVLEGIQTEAYQSPRLQAARAAMPGAYGPDDGSLIILNLQGDRQVFMMGGKVSPQDEYDMDNTIGGGVDERHIDRIIYAYDGVGEITEYMRDGTVSTYSGDEAEPAFLVSHIRRVLGTCVATEIAGKPVPFDQV